MFKRYAKFCVAGIGMSVLPLNVQVYWLKMNIYLANFISIKMLLVTAGDT